MHQGYRGEEGTLEMLDRFARYGLPLHMTETSLVSGHLMPPEIVDLNDYRIADWPTTPDGEAAAGGRGRAATTGPSWVIPRSTPSRTGASPTRGAWLGAPVGLVRRDGTPKPAYEALRDLIRGEWWLAPTAMRTDAAGRVRVRGFQGDYAVSRGRWHGGLRGHAGSMPRRRPRGSARLTP